MVRALILTSILLGMTACQVQEEKLDYVGLIQKADSLYDRKDFKGAAYTYSDAFKSKGWKGSINDHYNAACCWALANIPDSAFFHLQRISQVAGFQDYGLLMSDTDFKNLYNDQRWGPLTELVKKNKEKAEANLDKPLVAQLDSIYLDDQALRMQIQETEEKTGPESIESKQLWMQIERKDSINLIKVKAILDKYGWLGPDVVGNQGSSTLFLVIQHANLKTQEAYLPMMRDAVKKGKAAGSNLALLEDRIEIGNGRKQIYGSQIEMDKDNKYYVSPLLDPDNVDKRRAAVGLEPMADYVKFWNMSWDVALYKKDLPRLESIQEKY